MPEVLLSIKIEPLEEGGYCLFTKVIKIQIQYEVSLIGE